MKLMRLALLVCTMLAMVSVLYVIWPKPMHVRVSSRVQPIVDLSKLHIEVVDTDEARAHGLSDRESLPMDRGMLFVFERRGIYPFWMKDMKFPLDIIWLDGDTVVDVVTLSAPQVSEAMIPRHVPSSYADRVLEVNAGQATVLGLTKDARVHFSEKHGVLDKI